MKRRLTFLAAVIAAVVVGVGSASALISTEGRDAVGLNTIHPDGRGSVIAATTPDPVSGRLWAVRVYHTTEGQTCAEVGRSEGGKFGQYDDADRFQALDVQGGGGCTDFVKSPISVGITRFPERSGHDARSVLSGLVTGDVQRVELRTIAGTQNVAIQNGAYVAIVNEPELATGAGVDAAMRDGSTVSYRVSSSHLPEHELPSDE